MSFHLPLQCIESPWERGPSEALYRRYSVKFPSAQRTTPLLSCNMMQLLLYSHTSADFTIWASRQFAWLVDGHNEDLNLNQFINSISQSSRLDYKYIYPSIFLYLVHSDWPDVDICQWGRSEDDSIDDEVGFHNSHLQFPNFEVQINALKANGLFVCNQCVPRDWNEYLYPKCKSWPPLGD